MIHMLSLKRLRKFWHEWWQLDLGMSFLFKRKCKIPKRALNLKTEPKDLILIYPLCPLMALASPSLSYNTIFCEMRWLKCPLWFLPPPSFYIWFYYYTYIWFHLAVIYKYIIKALLLEQFWVNSKIEGKIQSYPMYSLPPQEHSLPMNNIVTHLLSLMNLHWHLIIIHSAQFTLGFTLGVVHSVALDKHIMMHVHHYGIMQSIFRP